MSTTGVNWYRFTTSAGAVVVGPVHGSGGMLASQYRHGALERMEITRQRALLRQSLSIYEPEPGHVCVYPKFSHRGNGPAVHVDLTDPGLTIEVLAKPGDPRPVPLPED